MWYLIWLEFKHKLWSEYFDDRKVEKWLLAVYHNYCKTLNVSVPFISRISRAKLNREIKGREGQNRTKLLQYFELYGFNSPK